MKVQYRIVLGIGKNLFYLQDLQGYNLTPNSNSACVFSTWNLVCDRVALLKKQGWDIDHHFKIEETTFEPKVTFRTIDA